MSMWPFLEKPKSGATCTYARSSRSSRVYVTRAAAGAAASIISSSAAPKRAAGAHTAPRCAAPPRRPMLRAPQPARALLKR
jgi:hypothetical protein